MLAGDPLKARVGQEPRRDEKDLYDESSCDLKRPFYRDPAAEIHNPDKRMTRHGRGQREFRKSEGDLLRCTL